MTGKGIEYWGKSDQLGSSRDFELARSEPLDSGY
jgi:hypothetical protein